MFLTQYIYFYYNLLLVYTLWTYSLKIYKTVQKLTPSPAQF